MSWAVVGGGVLGMTVAHRLAQRGFSVTLFEAADHLGGLASAWALDDVVWDRHYHVTLLSDVHLRALLSELGLEREIEWVSTRTGFYTDGELLSMSNTLEFLSFPPLGILDKLRLGGTIFYASRLTDWKRLEKISVEDWLTRWSGRKTVEKIWLPLLRAKLGENYKQTSAAFIWATIARMYAARRTGLKREMFGYVPGGYARVLERFRERLDGDGVRIRLGTRVSRVDRVGEEIEVDPCTGARETFDRAVVTLPAPLAAKVCPGLSAVERGRLEGVAYQGIVCASLLLERSLSPYYVTNITDSWVPFTAVIEMSALVDKKHFGGRSLVYLPKYLPSDDPAFSIPDEEWRESFLGALCRMYPGFSPDEVVSFRVSRANYVHAFSTLHYSDKLPPKKTSVPGLFIVNSAHIVNGTLNVNETVKLGEESLTWILNDGAAA
ncbi:MAG: NAD(P)/FAD-dependent oxidoreductase [Vicinamibacteria bacterium]